ncbi:biotin synthase BioB [bacterium]|nr:biotin synthase BioB [bacterium]
MNISELRDKIIEKNEINRSEALSLIDADLPSLCKCADEIREHYCRDKFDLCSIINAKSGKCSEDCKYCAQSAHYNTKVEEYSLLDSETIIKAAKENCHKGVLRFSLVTSGRKPSRTEIIKICEIIKEIKRQCKIEICASLGLVDCDDLKMLKEAGLTRIHNNLESSRKFFPFVCTTHTTDDKIKTIKEAQKLGIEVCSGGISGLGESFEDRIDLAFMLRELNIMSIPMNFLCAIEGTPYQNNKLLTKEEILRTCAIFRFINPKAFIRLAGGRYLTEDSGKECLKSGINSLITGDMLTTTGATILSDIKMATEMGYKIHL